VDIRSEHPREIWHDQHELLIFQISQPTRSILAAEGARPSLRHLRGLHSTTVRRLCRIAEQSFWQVVGNCFATVCHFRSVGSPFQRWALCHWLRFHLAACFRNIFPAISLCLCSNLSGVYGICNNDCVSLCHVFIACSLCISAVIRNDVKFLTIVSS